MKQSVLVLLSRSVDYAGMFPPAALPLHEAAARYAAMLAGPERFLLGRFVCPAARLEEVDLLRSPAGSPPVILAVLGAPGDSVETLRQQAAADGQRLSSLGAGATLAADQYEVALPPAVLGGGPAAVAAAAQAVTEALAARRRTLVALEVPVAGAPPELVADAIAGMAQANRRSPLTPVCLKVRCGGATAAAVPTAAELAAALAAARDHGVLIKATQGLHHPLRHRDVELGCSLHGFLNLFAAVVLARTHRLDADGIAEVLEDEDADAFTFTDSGFAWRHHPASLEALAAGRRFGLTSFGSCSVDEPMADLRSLGLLD
jgi:hypothetical protein